MNIRFFCHLAAAFGIAANQSAQAENAVFLDEVNVAAPNYEAQEYEATFAPWYPMEDEIMLRSSWQSPPLLTAIDFHTRKLYLINYKTDQMITVDPMTIKGWPGDLSLQHTIVSASGRRIIITTDSSESEPARAIELDLLKLSWHQNRALLEVSNIHELVAADTAPAFPPVKPVNKIQNIPQWTVPGVHQIHGPSLLPKTNLVYLTDWSNNQVRVLDVGVGGTATFDPIIYPGYTEQTHGIMFNRAGTLGLGTGYYYDDPFVDLYKVAKNGKVHPVTKIMLGTKESYASFTHYVSWLDNRYAVTASMQLDKTSRTPSSVQSIIGPSIWLIDSWTKKSHQVVATTTHVDGAGIYRSASDVVVAGGKLFVAEEDTLDYDFANDGYVSIFSLREPLRPRFLTRLRPGVELPADYAVAHTMVVTPDERFVYVASWASGYIVKIDVASNKVVKTFGPESGMVMPHGIFIAGGIR